MEVAWRELGQHESAGSQDNPRILAFYRDAGHPEVRHDEIAWCAAFAGACLERVGIGGTGSLMARSYATWGEPEDEGRLGSIVVLTRGADPALGHVGFLVGEADGKLILLGGNQNDAVGVAAFDKSRLVALRWPSQEPAMGSAPDLQAADFDAALAHVLEMEGGWSDDPYDPGGPTNFGITLKVFAAWRRISVDALTYPEIKQDLRRIDPATVQAIYAARYWQPSGCEELSAPLALMHFDAAVNHGVGTAIRILQESVGAAGDGEIGPETRAALKSSPVKRTLSNYAEVRRKRYRALPHFWRFGRGWLRRVDRTLARANDLADAGQTSLNTQQKGSTSMTSDTSNPAEPKWWGQSMTIWGALMTAVATVLPAIGPALGIDITPELVREAGSQIVAVAQAVAGLLGTLLTIYGRVRATQPLMRRDVSLTL